VTASGQVPSKPVVVQHQIGGSLRRAIRIEAFIDHAVARMNRLAWMA